MCSSKYLLLIINGGITMSNQLIASEEILSTEIINHWDLEKAWSIFKFLDISEGTRKDYQYRLRPFLNFIHPGRLHQASALEYNPHLKLQTHSTLAPL